MSKGLRRVYTFYLTALCLVVVCGAILGAFTDRKQITPQETEKPTTAAACAKSGTENAMLIHNVSFEPETEPLPDVEYIGAFTCTAYCPCEKCCGQYAYNRPKDENGNPIVYGASGAVLTPRKSVAVDPSIIPLGTVLIIDGNEYIAQDTGGFHGYHLDFYFATHDEAWNFGRQTKEVYIKRG